GGLWWVSDLRIYLDYNATAPLRDEAREAMIAAMDMVGNPSSVHAEGRKARGIIERAREQVAALVGGAQDQIVFGASATELLNQVVRSDWEHIFVGATEHAAVLEPLVSFGLAYTLLDVGADGVVDDASLNAKLDQLISEKGVDPAKVLVVVQAANNETGVLQPIDAIGRLVRDKGARILCDAVQVAGRLPIDVAAWGVDYLVVSSHKMGGPKGAAALWCGCRRNLRALIKGGGQEQGYRGGTENVTALAGFAAAAEVSKAALETAPSMRLRMDDFEAAVQRRSGSTVIIAQTARRLVNTTLLAHPALAAERLLMTLDLRGFAVSSGAACSSGKVARSHVLEAMGVDAALSGGAIRISIGPNTTADELAKFTDAWVSAVERAAPASNEIRDGAQPSRQVA
ncbi:MAG: cysteine desulfurase family protein, partial [Pseudomonadota bacterium]